MTRDEIIERIRKDLGDGIIDWFDKSERRIFIEIAPADVPKATELIFRELGARFQIASGVDAPTAIEILYHWAFDQHDFLVILRTKLDRDKPEIESVAGICKGTEWIEREMWELLGIKFNNHPDMRHLLLTDEWEGQYPLRRDWQRPDASTANKRE